MTAIIAEWLFGFMPWILAAFAALGAYFLGNVNASRKANNENEKANLNAELERTKAANAQSEKATISAKTTSDSVSRLDDSAVDKQLQDKWNG